MKAESDIFNFVAIRNPLLISSVKKDQRFIFDKRPRQKSQVLSLIESLRRDDTNFKEIYSAIKDIISEHHYTANFTLDKYPKFQEINDLINRYNDKFDKHAFLKELEKILGINPKDFLKEEKTMNLLNDLWESLYSFTIIMRAKPQNIEILIQCLRIFHILDYISTNPLFKDEEIFKIIRDSVPSIPQILFADDELTPLFDPPICNPDSEFLHPQFPPAGSIKVLGVGDLKVVKQKLQKYELGEIAHIENVLKSETKERKYKTSSRTEQTVTTEAETTELNEKDLQSTDRFELKAEAEKTINNQSSLQAGVTVSGGYGPVQITAQTNFSTGTSTTESARNSSTFAKEIISKSVSKIQKRVKEMRTTKTVTEIQEINDHGFKNDGPGSANISGIYRWVDKHYQAQVYNYGKRLMFEFIIPEPGAFYNYLQSHKPLKGTELQKPSPPLWMDDLPLSPKDISEENYFDFIRDYGVTDTSAPPLKNITIGIPIDQPSTGKQDNFSKSISDLKVPEGYIALKARLSGDPDNLVDPNFAQLCLSIGDIEISPDGLAASGADAHAWFDFGVNGKFKDTVPIAIVAKTTITYAITIEVFCERSPEKFQTWQLNTYQSIMNAYGVLLKNYNEQVQSNAINEGVIISGRNPLINREIEKIELKKSCLVLFTRQDFSEFDAITDADAATGTYPEMDIKKALSQGKYIQFFEQAFDWENMTYLFYPYFWGEKDNWINNQFISDPDPLFLSFLQAGAARVILPARIPYQQSLLYFLQTLPPNGCGEIWDGGDSPTLDDPLYLSIVDEIKSSEDALDDPTPEGKPWDIIVPTDLVYLQSDSNLPDFTKTP